MELFWIVAGIIFIIYQACTENPRQALSITKVLLLLFGPPILGVVIASSGDEESQIVGAIVGVIGFIVGLILLIVRLNTLCSEEYQTSQTEKRKQEISDLMKQSGYDKVAEKHIDKLVTDPSSPLFTTKQLSVPISKCYYWLCLQRSGELQRMQTPQLEDIIGVPYSTYPRNIKKTLDESDAQKKHLVVKTIMEQEGLSYQYRFVLWRYDYYCTDDYSKEFVAYLRDHAPSLPEQAQENSETENLDTQENSVTKHLD